MAHYHTHPSNTGIDGNIDKPSQYDKKTQFGRKKLGIKDFFIYNIHGRIPY